jgi:hypothetical protein
MAEKKEQVERPQLRCISLDPDDAAPGLRVDTERRFRMP